MVVGAAGELPKPPEKPVVFLEGALLLSLSRAYVQNTTLLPDLDESSLAKAVRIGVPHFHTSSLTLHTACTSRWSQEPWQHLLHERNCTDDASYSRTSSRFNDIHSVRVYSGWRHNRKR